jgi:hypothetical protein
MPINRFRPSNFSRAFVERKALSSSRRSSSIWGGGGGGGVVGRGGRRVGNELVRVVGHVNIRGPYTHPSRVRPRNSRVWGPRAFRRDPAATAKHQDRNALGFTAGGPDGFGVCAHRCQPCAVEPVTRTSGHGSRRCAIDPARGTRLAQELRRIAGHPRIKQGN